MNRRVTILAYAILAGGLLGACSYTKKDATVTPPTRATVPVVPTGGGASVVGTLPPVSPAPTTTISLATAPPTPTEPETVPPAPPPKSVVPATPPATAAPSATTAAAATGGPVAVQAGAYDTAAAAAAGVAALGAKGFGGFAVAGSGPFRVQRGPMSRADAQTLVQQLSAAGVTAFVRG